MANLTRTKTKSGATRTKVLLVRQPVKSVRHRDEPDRIVLRLTIGLIVAFGILVSVWLIGYLGFRLGFAPAVRVPELLGGPGQGLATGTTILISIPRVIMLAGIHQPGWLIIGFAMIVLPAAALSASNPVSPGGPTPSVSAATFNYIGAVAACLSAIVLIWWAASDLRNSSLGDLPLQPSGASAWLEGLQQVAAFDVLATVAASLWVVLVMRLTIPAWLKAIAASSCFFALVVLVVALSVSNAIVANIEAQRSVLQLDEGSMSDHLLLGFTPGHAVVLHITQLDGAIETRLIERSQASTVVGRQSIIEMLTKAHEDSQRDRQ